MSLFWVLFCLFLRTAALRPGRTATELQADHAPLSAGPDALDRAESSNLQRVVRGAKDGGFWKRQPHPRRHDDPGGFFTTPNPRTTRHTSAPLINSSSGDPGLLNPLFPVTDGSYWAYAVLLLALVLFAAGLVGNLALMCIVWNNVYLKSTWNCILAGLAFWDFLVLFFCLPVVIFHELTLKRLLGDLSCRLVPYLEVTSLGVATFSLCALSIDRFHIATGPAPHQTPKVEPCQSILSKVGVIWVGSMVLAAPELLLWQLHKETISPPELQQNQPAASLMAALSTRSDPFQVDVCVCKPSEDLPEAVYALVLTYHEARVWWIFGCYLCLPLLFTLACDLVTQRVLSQRVPPEPINEKNRCSSSVKKHHNEKSLRAAVAALTVLYVSCNLPHSICYITLLYVSVPVLVVPVLALVQQFLLFVHCSAVPVLLLCLCRPLGRAFMDCCCCCCGECLSDTPSPFSLSPSCKEETIKTGSAAEPGRTLQLAPEHPAESRTTGTPR